MDLGIAGKRALVCASSKGLGRGCALALASEGVHVTLNGRSADTLEATAEQARALGAGEVRTVCCDITTEEGRAEALSVAGPLDILVNNAGGPPPGDFRDWDREHWLSALNANMLTPIELIKATIDGMGERGFGRIVNITSSSVKSPHPGTGTFQWRARGTDGLRRRRGTANGGQRSDHQWHSSRSLRYRSLALEHSLQRRAVGGGLRSGI